VSQSEHGGMENGDNSFNVTGIDRTASAIGRTAFENQKSYPTVEGPEDIPMDTQSNHSKTSKARSQGAHTTRSDKSATLSKKERDPKKPKKPPASVSGVSISKKSSKPPKKKCWSQTGSKYK